MGLLKTKHVSFSRKHNLKDSLKAIISPMLYILPCSMDLHIIVNLIFYLNLLRFEAHIMDICVIAEV
jgi:hypothetical protein